MKKESADISGNICCEMNRILRILIPGNSAKSIPSVDEVVPKDSDLEKELLVRYLDFRSLLITNLGCRDSLDEISESSILNEVSKPIFSNSHFLQFLLIQYYSSEKIYGVYGRYLNPIFPNVGVLPKIDFDLLEPVFQANSHENLDI